MRLQRERERAMWYNLYCLNEQNYRGNLFYPHNLSIAGKLPSVCGLESSAVRLGNDSTHGGHFAMSTKKCITCGKEFIPHNGRQLTCSSECGITHRRVLNLRNKHKNYKPKPKINTSKICIVCGKEFIPKHGITKTCSKECKRKHNRELPSRLSLLKHFETVNCAYCGESFIPKSPIQKCCCEDHGEIFYRINRKKKYSYICKYCGDKYWTFRKDCDQYCSREHSDLSRSLSSDERKRAREELLKIPCQECGKIFYKNRSDTRFCSSECYRTYNLRLSKQERIQNYEPKRNVCNECGCEFVSSYGNKHRSYCSDKCRRKHFQRTSKAHRRAKIRGNEYEVFDPLEIFERDHWRCQLCGMKTPKRLRGTLEDRAPELDHIIPLALGGPHTRINTQCLCRLCNQRKGATIAGQLRFV